jgi:hypothetical protein
MGNSAVSVSPNILAHQTLSGLDPPFSVLREIVSDGIPRCSAFHKSVKLRPNARIIVEGAHTDRHLIAIGPIAAEEARTAVNAERFDGAFPFSINLD